MDVQLHGTMFTGCVFVFLLKIFSTYKYNHSEGGQQGEAETAVAGTVRLQSDYLVSLFSPL